MKNIGLLIGAAAGITQDKMQKLQDAKNQTANATLT